MPIKERNTSETYLSAAAAIPAASAILLKAADVIHSRGTERDTSTDGSAAERSMAVTVRAFNALHGTSLTERQGWMFMVILKAARANASAVNGAPNLDDYLDGAAYFALAGESIGLDAEQPQ